jgi:hypothetical protein
MTRKNLVIGVVGDQSDHETWLSDPAAREFDLCLIYYGDQTARYAEQAEYYYPSKGIKFSLIHALCQEELGKVLEGYEMIWLPDDDIATDTHQINKLFQLAAEHRLQIAQPAIGLGDVSYQSLRRHRDYLLRYTGFVEMMCPLFTAGAFARTLPLFAENISGWGLDWVWSNMYRGHDVAVIDAVGVHHTRPISSGGVHQRFAQMGIDPIQEFNATCQTHGISRRRRERVRLNRGRFRALSTDGSRVWTRSLWPWRNPRRAA